MQPLMVTTQYRGVFFGYGEPETQDGSIRLERVRMAIYWPAQTHGVLGLAAYGPPNGSRIGPAAPSMLITGVTAVVECTPEAAKRWEMEPWE